MRRDTPVALSKRPEGANKDAWYQFLFANDYNLPTRSELQFGL